MVTEILIKILDENCAGGVHGGFRGSVKMEQNAKLKRGQYNLRIMK